MRVKYVILMLGFQGKNGRHAACQVHPEHIVSGTGRTEEGMDQLVRGRGRAKRLRHCRNVLGKAIKKKQKRSIAIGWWVCRQAKRRRS